MNSNTDEEHQVFKEAIDTCNYAQSSFFDACGYEGWSYDRGWLDCLNHFKQKLHEATWVPPGDDDGENEG